MIAGFTLGASITPAEWGLASRPKNQTPAKRAHSHHIKPEDITMLRTFPTPISRLASAVRHLLLPAVVLAAAACDNPTEPIRANPRPSLALTAPTGKGQILFTSGSFDSQQFVVDPVTMNVVQQTSGPDYHSVGAWSVDYTKITFSKGLWGGLWTMDADGTNETQVLAMPQEVRSSVFSPDGKYIAFIANVPDPQVHTVELATGVIKQLTNLTGLGLRISWSFDGKKLLFTKEKGGIGNLFTIAPDGTGLKQITKCVKVYCNDGQFSPDGTQIAFIYGGQVATIMANGANMQLVTSAADPQPHYPSWSPKGDRLAYERYAINQHDIWIVDLGSGATTPVVTSRVDDTTPSWSR